MSERRTAPAEAPKAGQGGRLVRVGAWLVGVLGSYTLAVTLLLLLLVLTAVGTFAQAHMSLYDVQRRYFDSLVAVIDVGPVSIPLPGGALTIAVLSLNLIVGGVIRLRRGSSTAGILVAHLGMLLLFAGGLVETLASDKGQLTLHEPARGGTADALSESDRFSSYYEWELAVGERKPDGTFTEHVIPWSSLEGLGRRSLRATSPDLPFEVLVSGWSVNGRPRRAVGPSQGVNGWVVEALEREMEAERNVPAAVVTLARPGGSEGPRAVVWGRQTFPWAATTGGRTFEVDLRHRSLAAALPRAPQPLRAREHPGTRMDSRVLVLRDEDRGRRRARRPHHDERAAAPPRLHLLPVGLGPAGRAAGHAALLDLLRRAQPLRPRPDPRLP